MPKTLGKLKPELVESLQGEKLVSLITVDHAGEPQLSVVSWVVADEDGTKINIAVGHKSSSVTNILGNPNVTLGLIGHGKYYSVKGEATVSAVIEKTMKYKILTIEVQAVEDVTFYGAKITVEPEYEKTYDPDLARKLDTEVYQLLKQS